MRKTLQITSGQAILQEVITTVRVELYIQREDKVQVQQGWEKEEEGDKEKREDEEKGEDKGEGGDKKGGQKREDEA